MYKACKTLLLSVMILVMLLAGSQAVFADEEDEYSDYDTYMEEFHTIMRQFIDEFADHDLILKTQGDDSDEKSYRLTADQKSEIKELALSVTGGCDTDYEKIKAVCEYVSDNLYYDYPAYWRNKSTYRNAYTAWKNKRTVCDGYARLTEAMLDFINIPCLFVIGEEDDDFHVFNAAYDSQENRWIYFDPTFCSKNQYVDGEFKHFGVDMSYFDMDVKQIANLNNHTMLNIEDYLNIVVDGVKYLLGFSWEDLSYSDLNIVGVEDPNAVELNIIHDLYKVPVGYMYSSALDKCKNLETINLPDNIRWITYSDFEKCVSLKTVNYGGTMAEWHKMVDPSIAYWNKYLGNAMINCSDGTIDQPNTMTAKATKKVMKVRYKKLKKKSLTVTGIKVVSPIGRVRYKKVGGTSKLKVNSKTGKITVKKGTGKKTYKIKVRVCASGKDQYRPGVKTVLVKVKVA